MKHAKSTRFPIVAAVLSGAVLGVIAGVSLGIVALVLGAPK